MNDVRSHIRNKARSRFEISAHALVRYVERATRIPFDSNYLSLLRERAFAGLFERPRDVDVIARIERGESLDKYRKRLACALDGSRVIHEDEAACYRAAGNGLVVVTDRSDRTAMTVLTRELAVFSVPRQVLIVEGIHDEDPLPTRSYEEIMRARAFPYIVRGKAGRLADRLARVYPPVQIVEGAERGMAIVGVKTRQSLEAMERQFSQVKPHLVDMTVANPF